MNIREANIQDARDIAKIHVEAWQKGYKRLMLKEFLGSLSIESKTVQWANALTTKDPRTYLVNVKDGTEEVATKLTGNRLHEVRYVNTLIKKNSTLVNQLI